MQRRCAGRGISLPLRGRVLPRGATCRAHRRRQLARYVIAVRCKKSTRLELSRRRSKPMLASRRTTIDQRCGHGGQRGAGAGPELGAAAGCPQHGARRAWGGAAHHRGGAPRHHHARPSGNALNGPRDFSGERRQRPATRDADARLFLCPKLSSLRRLTSVAGSVARNFRVHGQAQQAAGIEGSCGRSPRIRREALVPAPLTMQFAFRSSSFCEHSWFPPRDIGRRTPIVRRNVPV